MKINKELGKRYDKSKGLQKAIQSFCERIADKHKPAQKLHNATTHAMRRKPLDQLVGDLAITGSITAIPRDHQITMEAQMARLKVDSIVLNDRFSLLQASKSADSKTTLITLINVPRGDPAQLAKPFFQACKTFMDDCMAENLWKLNAEGTLHYARIVRLYKLYCHSQNTDIERGCKGHLCSRI